MPKLLDLADVGPLYTSFSSQATQGEAPILEVSGEPEADTVDITFEMVPPAAIPKLRAEFMGRTRARRTASWNSVA